MKFKKIICTILLQFMLVLIFSNCTNESITAYAKAKKATTICIDNVNSKVCEKIHKNLSKGNPIVLKVKGSKAIAKKKITKTVNSVREMNKQGIYFKYKETKKKGKYCYYTVSADNAKAYKYGVKFVEELYKMTKEGMSAYPENTAMLPYYRKYKNIKGIKLHIIYDRLCYKCDVGAVIEGDTSFITSDANIFKLNGIDDFNCSYKLTEEQWYSLVVKEYFIQENGPDSVKLYTFQEFKQKIKQYPQALKAIGIGTGFSFRPKKGSIAGIDDIISIEDKMPMTKIMASTCFGELSKANQVYLIEQSGYFAIRDDMFKTEPKYTIRYSYDYLFDKKIKARTDFNTPGQGMEKMYKHNIIIGVCSVYADYEELLFSQLGIAVWNCTDDNIGHAWTVLKVKNTAGKTLWIPFDYGIGPAERLIIDEKIIKKYLRTEKMRYKLYLSKVKGAPKKKNFKLSDFV